jgi:hypothetical protein
MHCARFGAGSRTGLRCAKPFRLRGRIDLPLMEEVKNTTRLALGM